MKSNLKPSERREGGEERRLKLLTWLLIRKKYFESWRKGNEKLSIVSMSRR